MLGHGFGVASRVCTVWKPSFCFLLLMCFCWLAVRAVAGLARPLVAFAAVLCCCRCCCARRLPITAADCEAAADYACEVAVAIACCFVGGSGTQQSAWCHFESAAKSLALPCAMLAQWRAHP